MMRIDLPNRAGTAEFINCDDMPAMLRSLLCGWAAGNHPPADETQDPTIRIERVEGGYRFTSPWVTGRSFRDTVDTLCALSADMIRYFADANGLICLHAGAVDLGGRLLVLPDTYRQGKSVLSAHLLHQGARLFSDDVLPIEENGTDGMAIGALPRLRLPLPDDSPDDFRQFIEDQTVQSGARYNYFGTCETHIAPHGETAPIGHIVMLDRNDGTPATLEATKGSDTLARLIEQNFAKSVPAPDTLERLHQIVENADCYILHYGTAKDGAGLLLKELG